MSTDTERIANDIPRIPVHATEDYRVEFLLYCLDSTCSKIKLMAMNVPVYEDNWSYAVCVFVRRLHVNDPQQQTERHCTRSPNSDRKIESHE